MEAVDIAGSGRSQSLASTHPRRVGRRDLQQRMLSSTPGTIALAFLLSLALVRPAYANDPEPKEKSSGPATAFAECLEQLESRPNDYDSSFCYYQKARSLRLWQEASHLLDELIDTHPHNHWLRLTLAHIHARLDPPKAEDTYRAAADGFKTQGDTGGEVLARVNLYSFLSRRGSLESAAAEVERVVEITADSQDPVVKSRALVLEAEHLRDQGRDLETAYRLLRRAQPWASESGVYRLKKQALKALGSICYRLGRYGEARRYYQELADLAALNNDDYARASFRYNQANTLSAEMFELPTPGGRERLIEQYRQALSAAQDAGHRSAELRSRRNLGELLSPSEADRAEAWDHFEACEQLAGQMHSQRRLAGCLRAKGSYLARIGALEEAKALLQRALDLANEVGDDPEITRIMDRMVRSDTSGTPSFELIETALDSFESRRNQQLADQGRAELFAAWSDLYAWPAGKLLNQADSSRSEIEKAFSLIERLRARVLLESMVDPRPMADPPNPELETARAQVASIQRILLNPQLSDRLRRRTLRQLEAAEMREAEARQAELRGHRLRQGSSRFASLSEIENALEADHAILSFQIGLWQDVYGDFGGGSWLLVTTSSGTRTYRLPDRAALRPAIQLFNGLFDARDGSETRAATRLYRQLLAEALEDLAPTIRRLTLVPDGDLHALPFSALRSAPEDPPLSDRYELARAPSATLWLHWQKEDPVPKTAAALVLADPVPPFFAEPARHSPQAPEPSQEAAASPDVETEAGFRDWALADGARLPALPFSRVEGKKVARRLGNPSRLRLGSEASEAYLKESSLEPFGVVHFATHAVIDAKRPHRSAVLLTPGSPREDGLLQPRDIAGLDFSGQVVVLSACQAASGAVLRGEGVMSLARAFFAAGATAVVGSLWPLRDDEAAAFFETFYGHLAEGNNLSAALGATQVELSSHGAPAAAWAGLTVLGDGSVAMTPKTPSTPSPAPPWALGLTGILVLTVLLGLGLRYRARHSSTTV